MTEQDPLRKLWATDTEEKYVMSIAELTEPSGRFQSKIQRRNITEYLAAALVVGVFGWLAVIVPVWSVRIGAVLIIAAALFIAWKLNRIASSSKAPSDPTVDNLASFHRRELERQRDALRSVWKWYLMPFVPGLVVFSVGSAVEGGVGNPIWVTAVIAGLGLAFNAAVFAGVWALNAHAARKLDDEIRALDKAAR